MGISPVPTARYELKTEERSHYLYAHVKSNITSRSITEDYLAEIADRLDSSGCSKLLLEKENPDSYWIWDAVVINSQLATLEPDLTRVAIVDRLLTDQGRDDFGVVIGRRGKVKIHFFKESSPAESWLLADADG